jgi:O-antigen/teichoic acid export membrane protein
VFEKFQSRIWSDRALFIQSGLSWGIRLVTTLLSFINLKLLGTCLDTNAFGSILLIYGLLPWFSLLDFGLSPVAQNAIARAKALGNDLGALTRNFVGLICVFAIFWLTLWVFQADSISSAFIGNQSDDKLSQLLFIGGFSMIIIGLGGVGPRILLGSGKVLLSQLVSSIATVATTFVLGLFYLVNVTEPVAFLSAFLIPNVLVVLVTLSVVYFKAKPASANDLIPWKQYSGLSIRFLLFAIISSLTLQIDYILLAKFCDFKSAALYAVSAKVFALVAMMCATFCSAMMPRFTAAHVRGDGFELGCLIRNARFVVLAIIVLFGGGICIAFPWIINFVKVGVLEETDPWIVFTILFWTYMGIQAWISIESAFLQANNFVNVFLWGTPLQAIISVTAQYILVQKIGAMGILCGMIIGQISVPLWLMPLTVKKISNRYK